MGVPLGTPISMPGWQLSHGRTSQNGEVMGPFTGQMRPAELTCPVPELCPGTGPAGMTEALDDCCAAAAAWAAWIWAWILPWMAETSPSSFCDEL